MSVERLVQRLVDIGGTRLEVFAGGAGEVLLCSAHPESAYPPVGHPFTDQLARLGRLVVVNPRHAGHSSPATTPQEFSLDQLVDDLEALRQRLGGERWVFAGTSTGGLIGLLYALRHPEALGGLIVANSAASGGFDDDPDCVYNATHPRHAEVMASRRRAYAADAGPEALRSWAAEVIHRPRRRGAYLAWVNSLAAPTTMPAREAALEAELRGLAPYERLDLTQRLGVIRVPTLVLGGRHDAIIPLRWSEQIAGAIPGAQLVVLERSAHYPAVDEPVQFRAAVRRFLRDRVSSAEGLERRHALT